MKDKIIKGIYKNHVYCCGVDLGEYKEGTALFCSKCMSLFLINQDPQKKITKFTEKEAKE